MSGGYFDYKDTYLKYEIYGYGDKWSNQFDDREISELVWDILNLLHDFDWYKSGDTTKETWLEKKTKFKKKWLDNRGVRVKRVVDTALAEVKQELYETYGVELDPPLESEE